MTATALIVDDEADIRELIAITLTRMGWNFHAAASLEEARNLLGLYPFDLCLTDMRLPDGNGVDFVKYAQKNKPQTPIAVITAHGNMEAAVDAMKNGAYDFVSKPVDISQLRQLVTQAVELKSASTDAANEAVTAESKSGKGSIALDESHSSTNSSHQTNRPASAHVKTSTTSETQLDISLMGESPLMQELHSLVKKVSRTNAPIWITGESGTGKEVIARSIHEQGSHRAEPFVTVNCGAIPANLIESELFGHKKGSFPGATSDYEGCFVQANGGTLFLNEVEQLPLQIQIKLLHAIQERCVLPVGEREEIFANVRMLSASHADLVTEVSAGRFRHDLYYRLNVITLRIPSLKERSSDIALLVEHLLKTFEPSQGTHAIGIDEDAIELLNNYDYPYNVRELENILKRASTMMENGIIRARDIELPKPNHSNSHNETAPSSANQSEDSEHARIVDALNKTHWNRKAAAEILGLTYRQLRYRIKQLGIDKTP